MKIRFITSIIKLFCLTIFVLVMPLFSEVERVPIEDRVYGIVHGENVPLRISPDDKARISTKLKNYEFVAVTKIGEGKEEGWVKIYNIPGKEGWIKKDTIEVIDSNDIGFKEILNNRCRIGRMLNSASKDKERYLYKIEKIDDYYYVSYLKRSLNDNFSINMFHVYKYIDGILWEVIVDNLSNGNLYVEKNRLFVFNKGYVGVYDSVKIYESEIKSERKDRKVMRMVASLSLNITNYLDSYMEFDPKTKIVTQYLRIKENQPYVIEKYQFKNDEFVQIGERQHEM
ncbi:MAG: hypothetical protein KBH06_12555 [Spirochaetes bacterium]|nr:hypothetical protein [Spirochaetota bacterium]